MADSTATIERLLEDLVRRAVENSLTSFREQFRNEIRQMLAGLGGASTPPPSPAMSAALLAPSDSGGGTAVPEINRAVARILQPTGQSEIMGALIECAGLAGGRCALFVRRGDTFTFWRAEGFSPEVAGSLRGVAAPASQPGIFQEGCQTLAPVSKSRASAGLPAGMSEALSGVDSVHLFPVLVQGKVVAALYADGDTSGKSIDSSALEILARVTGLSLETSAARTATPSAPPAQIAVAAPAPVAVPVHPSIPPPPEPDTLPEQDREIHKKAYRSARVAVQDLLNYPQNQKKIAEGRAQRTLYQLLQEEIDKNRETYQKRYGQTAAKSFDYLHYELVTKLAENDPDMLGSGYPGEFPR